MFTFLVGFSEFIGTLLNITSTGFIDFIGDILAPTSARYLQRMPTSSTKIWRDWSIAKGDMPSPSLLVKATLVGNYSLLNLQYIAVPTNSNLPLSSMPSSCHQFEGAWGMRDWRFSSNWEHRLDLKLGKSSVDLKLLAPLMAKYSNQVPFPGNNQINHVH